ncbi:MAG: carboxypeptidase-like regulatory domain-containing protein [Planctomycetota bacterium]|nr:carboxypeptidase-like regulatory domain-containing protein [Planctomycetota bacterium]
MTSKRSRIIVDADGYVSRIASYIRYDSQPGWVFLGSTLSKSASLAGKVVDERGKPLAGVRARLLVVTMDDTGDYKTALSETETNAKGLFEFSDAPQGEGKLTVFKPGLNGPPLGQKVSIPATDLTVKMTQAVEFMVKVNLPNGKAAENDVVNVEPVGGNKIGTWGGSATLDENNSNHFKNVQPGSYNVIVRPNLGGFRSATELVKAEAKGGDSKSAEVTYK